MRKLGIFSFVFILFFTMFLTINTVLAQDEKKKENERIVLFSEEIDGNISVYDSLDDIKSDGSKEKIADESKGQLLHKKDAITIKEEEKERKYLYIQYPDEEDNEVVEGYVNADSIVHEDNVEGFKKERKKESKKELTDDKHKNSEDESKNEDEKITDNSSNNNADDAEENEEDEKDFEEDAGENNNTNNEQGISDTNESEEDEVKEKITSQDPDEKDENTETNIEENNDEETNSEENADNEENNEENNEEKANKEDADTEENNDEDANNEENDEKEEVNKKENVKEDEEIATPFKSATDSVSSEAQTGVAKKAPTNVREKTSTKSNIIKRFHIGEVFDYKPYNDNWNEIKVDIDGKTKTGYIHKKHFTNVKTKPQDKKGVAKKAKTNVRAGASTKSKVIKSYSIGSALDYESFSKNWNQIKVKVDGKTETGYIHKKHVTDVNTKPEAKKGVAKKAKTNVRAGASTKSKVIKSYSIGSALEYESFSKNWNQIKVKVNGKTETGYIHKKHITNVKTTPKSKELIASKSPTNVRKGASTKSTVLKKIDNGEIINAETFSKNWLSVEVKVKGENKTGYVHKNHVGSDVSKKTSYNLSLTEALDIQTKKSSMTSGNTTMYVHKNALEKEHGKWVVKGKDWNIRSKPNTSSNVLGKLSSGVTSSPITVDEKNSTKDYYKFKTPWIIANQKDVKSYLDSTNFKKGTDDYFQFLVLSQSAGTKEKEVNDEILNSKGVLSNKASSFIKAGEKHNVNELYLLSHASLETGNGSSSLSNGIEVGEDNKGDAQVVNSKNKSKLKNKKKVYNMYGIGAIDSCAEECGAKKAYDKGWDTPEKAIIGGAKFIADSYITPRESTLSGQDTLYKMRWHPEGMEKMGNESSHQYASDIGWSSKQTSNLIKYYDLLTDYNLVFDVPQYK